MKFLFLICLLTMVLESRATPADSQMKVNFISGQSSVAGVQGNPKMNERWNDAPGSTKPIASQVAANTGWFSVAQATKAANNLFNMDRLLAWKLSAGSFVNVILKKSITGDQYVTKVVKQEFNVDNIVHTCNASQTKNLTIKNDLLPRIQQAKAMLKGRA